MNSQSKCYSYNEIIVQVSLADPVTHIWLEEFLCPQFQLVDTGFYDCQVTLIEDSETYERMLKQGAYPDSQQFLCFAMDSQDVYLPRWQSLEHDLVIFEEKLKTFYLINQENKNICLVTPNNHRQARLALMRVIRELAMNQCLPTNGLFLHGSAFTINGKGIIMVGAKGAGKTTLLIHALRHKLSQYLSNDRVWVSVTNEKVIFRGMPTIAAILPSTFEYFPNLKQRLLSSFCDSHFTKNEAQKRNIVPKIRKNGKYSLSPSQFCDLLQVNSVPEAQGKSIIFPKVTNAKGKFEFSKLSPVTASQQLRTVLLGNYSFKKKAPVFAVSDANINIDQNNINSICDKIVAKISCYQCNVGTEAYQNTPNTNDFVDFFLSS
ncbi:MAG: hypothetical protein AB4058_03800 [Microcystaceae cyanobacterium]